MRRAQSVRHYPRPSLALIADDLGALKETPEESTEDVLRRQLLEKDRENDKLQGQILALQAQLAQRPPLETIQALEKEYTNLEILLQGTQRENERCMTDLERSKAREKMLERELERIAGANWQANLEITPSAPNSSFAAKASSILNHRRTGSTHSDKIPAPRSSEGAEAEQQPAASEATLAHIEQVRLLIIGMEQRLQTREDKLTKHLERAEAEGARFDEIRKQVLPTSA
ncbi:hypothetical protein CERSUDRAFT_118649 [Gelatoporia subvermispora B]|uniref:Uncharacterized protein n=1 Tax=Ceriporiopsis subvermispora (strain B) TaxID=914234 RepID=M2R161_CERS8|nr:hypothetical protein CERSUDRAFT_118649 [Gelatoporia subvermispora B]